MADGPAGLVRRPPGISTRPTNQRKPLMRMHCRLTVTFIGRPIGRLERFSGIALAIGRAFFSFDSGALYELTILASFYANLSTCDENTLPPHENGAPSPFTFWLVSARNLPDRSGRNQEISCRRALCDRCANALIATRRPPAHSDRGRRAARFTISHLPCD